VIDLGLQVQVRLSVLVIGLFGDALVYYLGVAHGRLFEFDSALPATVWFCRVFGRFRVSFCAYFAFAFDILAR
jgi:hypothetical protein